MPDNMYLFTIYGRSKEGGPWTDLTPGSLYDDDEAQEFVRRCNRHPAFQNVELKAMQLTHERINERLARTDGYDE